MGRPFEVHSKTPEPPNGRGDQNWIPNPNRTLVHYKTKSKFFGTPSLTTSVVLQLEADNPNLTTGIVPTLAMDHTDVEWQRPQEKIPKGMGIPQ